MWKSLLVVALAIASSGCIEEAMARRGRDRRFGGSAAGGGFPFITNTESCDANGGDAPLSVTNNSDIWGGATSVSECIWLRKNVDPYTGYIHYQEQATVREVLFWFQAYSGDTVPEIQISSDGTNTDYTATVSGTDWHTGLVATNEWFFVCYTWSQTNDAAIYVNGVSRTLSESGTSPASVYDAGAHWDHAYNYRHSPIQSPLLGYFDEHGIWFNVELTAGEIALMYAAKGNYDYAQAPSGGPTHWYRCETSGYGTPDSTTRIYNRGSHAGASDPTSGDGDDWQWFNSSGDYVSAVPSD